MAKSAFSGPLIAYGQPAFVDGIPADYNPDLGPSVFWGGVSLLDTRVSYQPGQGDDTKIRCFAQTGTFRTVDAVPSTLAANNIAAAQVPVADTALTLVSSSAAGITVGASAINVITLETVTGLLVIDTAPSFVAPGTNDSVCMYDPTTLISRALRITSVGDDSAATADVVGYDIYGQPMTETITLTNASVATGVKCFKFIESITPAGTLSGSNVSVGTADVFGFPLRSDYFADTRIVWDNTVITASTGYTAAVTTDPATATTGDVRGKYGTQSASNGTRRLQIFQDIPVGNLGSTTGLFGVTQA